MRARELDAERLETALVHVDRAGTEVVATRQRDARDTATGQQRAEHDDRRTHPLDELVRRLGHDVVRDADAQIVLGGPVHVDAHGGEQVAHDLDVDDPGHVVQRELTLGHERGRHQLEYRVLRALDPHRAFEGRTRANDEALHPLIIVAPMPRLVTRTTLDRAGVDRVLTARRQPVLETRAGEGVFDAVEGPVWSYRREVALEPVDTLSGRSHVTETVDFKLAVPYFAWLMRRPFELAMRRPDTDRPWWMPPGRLDARASAMLGTLAGVAIIFGYLNTLFTQTIAFAGEEFGAGNSAQGLAGSVVRLGGLIALWLLAVADRRGRRVVLLGSVAAGCVLAATGALSPSLAWLTASQVLARGCAVAVLVVASIVTVEETPAGSRAWAVSLLAMAAGLGAGVCVAALRLADLGEQGWRLLYVLPMLALPMVRSIGRRLPETRRFERPHADVQMRGHGTRLWLLAVSGFIANVFVAPNAEFNNRFLRDERNYSGGAIALLTLGAGTPG